MALSPEDKIEIAKIFRTEINRGCVCGISSDTQSKMATFMGHFIGMAEDLGDGDRAKGIEIMREDMRFIGRIRKRGEKIGGAVILSIVIGITGAIIGLIGLGAKVAVSLWRVPAP